MNTTTPFARMLFSTAVFAALALPFSGHGASNHVSPVDPDDCLPKDPPPPVVKLKLRVPACGQPGQPIEYRICVENCSTAEAHHVIVKNALPSNAKFVKADPEPSKKDPELQWNLGTVGGGAVRQIILVLQPTNREDVKNCARVQFEHGLCVTTRLAARPGDRPPVITTIPPEEAPVLDLAVTGPKENYANLPARYEISLTNKGKSKAMNTQVKVRLPDKLKAIKASEPGVAVENVVVWNLGHLDPGAGKVLEVRLRATEKGEHCFQTTANADQGVQAEKETCTKFLGVSAMRVEMVGRKGALFVGDKTSYPFEVVGQGSEPVTNLEVRAFIPDFLRLERTSSAYDELPGGVNGRWIQFKKLEKLDGGSKVTYEVYVEAIRPGVTRFHAELRADQLENGPVTEQELTNIVDDRQKVKITDVK